MKVEQIPVAELIPYAKNARTHSDAQVAQIAASIREFGFCNPVLIDAEAGIIAGHGRVLAARKLAMESVPCIRLGHLSEVQKRAYILADNKLALNAGWDEAMLALELSALEIDGFDLDLVGFDPGELEILLDGHSEPGKAGADTEPEIDRAEELREKWGVETGQLWQLGEHRLLCGDSTNADDVKRVLGDERPHLMVTDPPYGVEYDPEWRSRYGINSNKSKLGKVMNDDRADWREVWELFPGDVAYVWHASMFTRDVLESLESCGFERRAMIIWGKDKFALSRGHYHWQHEPAWYVVKKGATGHWSGDRSQSTLWSIPAREDNGLGHGTQKPIKCMAKPVENNSNPGDLVYEPFSGSGTTIIACENLGRRCRAIEISPAYVAVALERWHQHTGKMPELINA